MRLEKSSGLPIDKSLGGFGESVVILSLATLLTVGTWAVSYIGIFTNYTWQFDRGTLSVYSYGDSGGQIGVTFHGEDWPYGNEEFSIALYQGQVTYYESRVARGTIVPTHDFELAGFVWQQSDKGLITSNSATTYRLTRSLAFPCWAPFLLFSPWPIIAFIRGPYRRAVRRARECCLKCGYNLTGLVEPRCPECGTAMSPDQVNRRMSVSV